MKKYKTIKQNSRIWNWKSENYNNKKEEEAKYQNTNKNPKIKLIS